MCHCAHRFQHATEWSAHFWEWLPIIIFTLVFGFRYGVGIDYNNYMSIYEYTEDYSLSDILEYERFEPGFSTLVYICHYINAPVYVFFSLIAFLQIYFIDKAFKDQKEVLPYAYMTLILTGVCMLTFMNIMRQIVAFCIFLFSIQYICNNKLLKYWICCLLALSFHKSAIILFPLYFIWIRKKGFFNKPIVLLVMILISICTVHITSWQTILHYFDNFIAMLGYGDYIDRAEAYVNSGGRGIGLFDLFELLIFAMVVFLIPQMKEYFKSDFFNVLFDLFIIGICAKYVFKGSMLLDRMIVYFTTTQFIILAYTLCYLYNTKKENAFLMIKYVVTLFFIISSYGRFTYYCEQNTGAYVSYFQDDLHNLKDLQREDVLEKH